MTLEKNIASVFKMDDQTWSRHANPWSVWTRFIILPFLILALWSRVWLGWWCIIPTAIVLLWTWFNPRLFPQPNTTNNWASKAVLGERVWLNRNEISIPESHQNLPNILNLISASGLPFLVWGIVHLEIYPTLLGAILVYAGKLWFLDRMVWLYEEMKDTNSIYRSWLY